MSGHVVNVLSESDYLRSCNMCRQHRIKRTIRQSSLTKETLDSFAKLTFL